MRGGDSMVDDSLRHGLALDTAAKQDAYPEHAAAHRTQAAPDLTRLPSEDAEGFEETGTPREQRLAEVRYLHHENPPLLSARRNLERPIATTGKRLLDIAVSGSLLALLSPLLAGVALWIKL